MSAPTPAAAKMCIACGQDCSNKPRTKDASGKYTCKACFDKAAAMPAAAKPASAPAKSKPAPRPAAPEPGEDAVMAALLKQSAPAALTETCPSCGSGLTAGAVVCTICGYNKETGRAVGMRIEKGPGKTTEAMLGAASVVGKVAAGPMAMVLALVGASVGGLIGAGLWAFLAYKTGYEIGWLAWGVGALCGFGALTASRRHCGTFTGLIAAAISLMAVFGGRYAAISMLVDDFTHSKRGHKVMAPQVSDEDIISLIARDVAKENAQNGKNYQWPEGVDQAHARGEDEFPAPIWKEAQARWDGMDQPAKDQRRAETQAKATAAMQQAVESLKSEGFMETFDLIDLLWIFLAFGSAYSIGSGMKTVGESAGAS